MPDTTVISASQSLTLRGIHHSADLDTAEWGATVSALRGLRHLWLSSMDEEMLPALAALTGLTSLHLGIRHSMQSSLVCLGRICSAVQFEPSPLPESCSCKACVSVPHVRCTAGRPAVPGSGVTAATRRRFFREPSHESRQCAQQIKPLTMVTDALAALVELHLTIVLKAWKAEPGAPPGVYRPLGVAARHTRRLPTQPKIAGVA